MAKMTKQAFTEAIRDGELGIWSMAAHSAIESKQVDLFIDHWKEQYVDEGSRPSVERMLGKDLLAALLNLIIPKYLISGHVVTVNNADSEGNQIEEGKAVLITRLQTDHYSEYWTVRFQSDGAVVNRWVTVDYDADKPRIR